MTLSCPRSTKGAANKTLRSAIRLGFVALLKFFELEGRFRRHLGEVPRAAVDYQYAAIPAAAGPR
jgi:hypothetical protein